MKNMAYGKSKTPRYEPCGNEEFAVAVGEQIEKEAGGQSRFGAMAVALKKLSDRYLMLTPPFIALLCRTFITLEGLLGDDPALVESYNVYQKSLPFAISRLLSPRTRKGCRALRSTLLDSREDQEASGSSQALQKGSIIPNWSSLSTLLTAGSQTEADAGDEPRHSRGPSKGPAFGVFFTTSSRDFALMDLTTGLHGRTGQQNRSKSTAVRYHQIDRGLTKRG